MNDPMFQFPNVGVLVEGPPTGERRFARWRNLIDAYADCEIATDHEAYLSHFVFDRSILTHYKVNNRSVAGFTGACWAKWIVFDIDRGDPTAALMDARKLCQVLLERYPDLEDIMPVYYSGSKGFHIYLELTHEPPPAVGFQHICRTLAEGLANHANVLIDTAIYDLNRILRLPNSRHAKTGLYKRRLSVDELNRLDMPAIQAKAKAPAGDGLPSLSHRFDAIQHDWDRAEQETKRKQVARVVIRQEAANRELAAPRYLIELLRFGVPEGERHTTLFRCAAWMAEQGSPATLVHAMLTEAGRDIGLSPSDVRRQIECGIEHARKQHEGGPSV